MTRAVPGSPGRPLGRRRRRVVITGTGAVGPFGAGTGALLEGIVAGRSPLERIDGCCCAPVRDPLAAGPFPPNAWRRLDRASRMAVLASAEALAEAGHDPASPDRAALPEGGVVLGTMTAGTGPLHGFLSTLFTQGPEAVSPMDFPFTVHNAPAGQCAILLGLKGPNLTTCRMEASGLAAIALAADLVRGGAADAVLAGGVDERVPIVTEAWRRWRVVSRGAPESYRGPFDRGRRGFAPGEGAYCVVLEESERARARGARPWAEIRAAATAHAPSEPHRWPDDPAAPARAIAGALAEAELGTAGGAGAGGPPRPDQRPQGGGGGVGRVIGLRRGRRGPVDPRRLHPPRRPSRRSGAGPRSRPGAGRTTPRAGPRGAGARPRRRRIVRRSNPVPLPPLRIVRRRGS